jgi:tetratricopeptide (TPR) repeat protein
MRQIDGSSLSSPQKDRLLRELSRRQEALLAYDELLRLNPQSAKPWVGKAWVLIDLKRYEEALDAFDHAPQLAPSLSTAVSGKRFLLEHLHHDEEAEALAQPDTTRTDRQPLAAQHCTTADNRRLGDRRVLDQAVFDLEWPDAIPC